MAHDVLLTGDERPVRTISVLDVQLFPLTLGRRAPIGGKCDNNLLTRLVQEEFFGILAELRNERFYSESVLLLPCI